MRKAAILALTVLLAATSCEYEFEVTPVDTTPKTYVECLPGLDNTTIFHIHKTIPVGMEYSEEENTFTVRRIAFTVNGVGADLYPLGDGLWKCKKTLNPGDELSFELETMETPKVKATTTIPSLPEFSFNATKVRSDFFDVLNFAIQFEDTDIREDDYYAISAYRKDVLKENPEENQIFAQRAYMPGTISLDYDFTGEGEMVNMLLISGKDIIEGRYNYITSLYEYGEDMVDYYYSLTVYHLSTEAYGFLFSEYNKSSNLMASIGLCPPNFSYTNIHGGYGVLGGISCVSTPFQQLEIN